jgi:hypothetical protein
MQPRPFRYDIRRPIEFRARDGTESVHGKGRTLNISRWGILFQTEEQLAVGARVEALVQMGPGQSDADREISLQVQGVTVRSEEGKVAIAIKKHRLQPVFFAADPTLS